MKIPLQVLAAAALLLVVLALGGCVRVFCHSAPLMAESRGLPPITADECVKGFKDQEEWRARPVAAPGACPGTSVWNGAGCTTVKP